jgi:hypothetical protein
VAWHDEAVAHQHASPSLNVGANLAELLVRDKSFSHFINYNKRGESDLLCSVALGLRPQEQENETLARKNAQLKHTMGANKWASFT